MKMSLPIPNLSFDVRKTISRICRVPSGGGQQESHSTLPCVSITKANRRMHFIRSYRLVSDTFVLHPYRRALAMFLLYLLCVGWFNTPLRPVGAESSELQKEKVSWKNYKSNKSNDMAFVAKAPSGWKVDYNLGNMYFISNEMKTSDGVTGSAVISMSHFISAPLTAEQVEKRFEKSRAYDDKRDPTPHRIIEKGKTKIHGQEAYYWLYTREAKYRLNCEGQRKYWNYKVLNYTYFVNQKHEVSLTYKSCHPEIFDNYLPTAEKIINSTYFGQWQPWTDDKGNFWKVFSSGRVRMSWRKGYFRDVTLSLEYPPDWTAEQLSKMNAKGNRESGRLVVDIYPPSRDRGDPDGALVKVWIEGLPITPHGLQDYLAMPESLYVSKLLISFDKSELQEIQNKRLNHISFDKNSRWSGSLRTYRRIYSGMTNDGKKLKVQAVTFASTTVSYNIFVVAPADKFDAFLEHTEKMTDTIMVVRKLNNPFLN